MVTDQLSKIDKLTAQATEKSSGGKARISINHSEYAQGQGKCKNTETPSTPAAL